MSSTEPEGDKTTAGLTMNDEDCSGKTDEQRDSVTMVASLRTSYNHTSDVAI